MPTETFTAGDDFAITGGVFNLTLTLEGEAGEDNAGVSGGSGGRVEGDFLFLGESLYIRDSQGGIGPGAAGDGGKSIDVRKGGTTLQDRIAVAGGGGGAASADGVTPNAGGDGGADFAERGNDATTGGGGASQTNGGSGGVGDDGPDGEAGQLGIGGDGADGIQGDGGGGGGGLYGGGGGGGTDLNNATGGGGGGGSNYDDGLETVVANERGTSSRSYGQGGLVTAEYDLQEPAQNFQISEITPTAITLNWDAPTLVPSVESVELYRVFRAEAPGTTRADYTEIATTTTPGYEDTGLDNGTEYHYRISADVFVPEPEYTITITDFRGI